jgi:phosphohistidine phosphatase
VRKERLTLHLLRHADAGDPGAWRGDDAARPLSAKGVEQAERLGRHLAAIGFEPDAIISSPKLRALQTAEIVARALDIELTTDERLAGQLRPSGLEELLSDAGSPRRPVLVGHDPDFSELLQFLAGTPKVGMRKGALARIDVDGRIRAGAGEVRWLLPPDAVAAPRPRPG